LNEDKNLSPKHKTAWFFSLSFKKIRTVIPLSVLPMKTLFHPLSAKVQKLKIRFVYIETFYDGIFPERDDGVFPINKESIDRPLNGDDANAWNPISILYENGNLDDRRSEKSAEYENWRFLEIGKRKNDEGIDLVEALTKETLDSEDHFNLIANIAEVAAGKRKIKDIRESTRLNHLAKYKKLQKIAEGKKRLKKIVNNPSL
jgi:hypothetical protein